MIDILDKKGRPLGLDHDYEYRGAMREANRDAPMRRAAIIWILFAALFATAGVIMIAGFISGRGESAGAVIFTLLFSFGFAALFLSLIYNGKRKHRQLLERIGKL